MVTRIITICQFLIIVSSVFAIPHNYNDEKVCGYQNCPQTDPNKLNIHIVPHSHDDVGWLKTVDQYYHGSKSSIQHAGVQFILDSAIQALLNNPERRFIYVETAFFWKWWKQQDNNIRDQVKYLINNGQLEIIGGAWSMNDEAAAHYQSTIDQFTWGFRKLNETLGDCARPKIGWQIDPFGHSREQASLFAQFGFDGLFFARLDYRDKDQRLASKTAEMLWQGSQSLGNSSQIFTHVLYNHYMTPPGFCFDVMCPDEPIVIDKESPGYNAKQKAQIFLDYCKKQATNYRTKNVIITMGGDFHYQDSLSYFKNMDFLIRAMREEDPNTNVFYSSPSCYLKAVHEANLDWTVKTDDFFPYASDPNSYWTGYFTSRPTSKRFERLGNNILQITKQLSALAFANTFESTSKLDQLREVMGIMQHHDAITGTEKQHVADDYHRMLTAAIKESTNLANEALQKLNGNFDFKSCLLLNISQCEVSENNENFMVLIYNPLSRPVNHFVRIPVVNDSYEVFDFAGDKLRSQIVPIFELIQNIPGRKSEAKNELVFEAKEIPPLGNKIFTIKYVPTKDNTENSENYMKQYDNIELRNDAILIKDTKVLIKSSFHYYNGETGNNVIAKNRSSGAYIFRPKETEAIPIEKEEEMKQYTGPVLIESHQKYNSWLGYIARIYNTERRYIEYNWIAGPLPVNENAKIGKEIVICYHTSFDNEETPFSSSNEFYTDSNGREMLKRIRDYRASFNLTNEEPVSQNYYPITSKISIRSDNNEMQASILNDRAQGGSSLHDGELELMIHRRLLRDDSFGVDEALNEHAFQFGLVAVGKHYYTHGYTNNAASGSIEPNAEIVAKELEKEILLAPWIFFTPLQKNEMNLKEFNLKEKSGLKNPLPNNVQILTLEPWADNTLLLRLEHIYEKGDDPRFSIPITVDIQDLFASFNVDEIHEMNLGANQLNSEVVRLQWKAENNDGNKNTFNKKSMEGSKVTLNPMEIKTFVIKVSASKI